jgi:Protein of unknown function (DUF4236)
VALRFRKSIKLAPGIRWNLSGSGSSWSLGPRGASIGVGKRGTFLNTGIPGTGLSSRSRVSAPSSRSPRSAPTTTTYSMTCGIRDDGTLFFEDASGSPMSDHLVEVAKKQNKEAILGLIQRKCDEINEKVEALGRMHHDTSDARVKPRFVPPAYAEPEPSMPKPQALGFLDKIFKSRRQRVEAANRAADARYREALSDWRKDKADFERQRARRQEVVEKLIYEDLGAMEGFLEDNLQDITWPRETDVAFDIRDGGASVLLDVDLPEVEDMPTKLAAMPGRGLKLSVKEMTATKVQRLYAEHVHGILFRLIGEVFAALPTVQTVVASGYSQRRDPATAQMRDDYLLSVRVQRPEWEANDFAHLNAIDVVSSLARYDLRRDMLKSGMLKSITPHMA